MGPLSLGTVMLTVDPSREWREPLDSTCQMVNLHINAYLHVSAQIYQLVTFWGKGMTMTPFLYPKMTENNFSAAVITV